MIVKDSKDALQKIWGYADFREFQEEIIDSILLKQDTLALLPTGGGKSICYQLPALLLDGVCLVISPLLALMKDQILGLKHKGIEALLLSSEQNFDQQYQIFERLHNENIKLLYVSPERLHSYDFQSQIKQLKISFIAVDEAHCISEWGNDFRPAYQDIKDFRQSMNHVPILALTATATEKVMIEIIEKLNLQKTQVFKDSFKRNNLAIKIKETQDKIAEIELELQKNKCSTLIYTRTRNEAMFLSKTLKDKAFQVDFFHAGLSTSEKNKKQTDWMQSNSAILVATNAFGMGIDKENVHLVIHYSPPYSLENYYQEIGRAGRNGQNSKVILYYNAFDFEEMKGQLLHSVPSKNEYEKIVKRVYNEFQLGIGDLPENPFEISIISLSKKINIEKNKIVAVLDFLQNSGIIYWNKTAKKSKIKILLQPTQMEFMDGNDVHNLENISRSYDGIFTHLLSFDEQILANQLQISIELLNDLLVKWQKLNYIEYYNGNKQYIQFLTARDDYYTINRLGKQFNAHQEHKILKYKELEFFIKEKTYCRMKLILGYFNEKSNENCGKCDVCLKKKNNVNTQPLGKQIEQKIYNSPTTLQEILLEFSDYDKEKILIEIQELLSEGKVKNLNYNTYTKWERN